MSKLLYIESSPRKTRSTSIAVAREFLSAYQERNPETSVETWDLWNTELPEFNGAAIDAKYSVLHGKPHSEEEARAWQEITRVFERFNVADKFLIGVPMWNFSIPYRLKQFFDVIIQPGLAFQFSPETGYKGLVTGKPIVMIYARGGRYTADTQMQSLDFQRRYLETILGFIGFTDIRTIIAEPTVDDPDEVASSLETAKSTARELGREF